MPTKTRKNKKADRQIICQDAIKWLATQTNLDCIVTSVPEMDEVKLKEAAYEIFFRKAVELSLNATKDIRSFFRQIVNIKDGLISPI